MTTLGELHQMIGELIERDPDAADLPAMAEYDYGDRGHTRALVHVAEVAVLRTVRSAYSDSGLALERDADGVDATTEVDKEGLAAVFGGSRF